MVQKIVINKHFQLSLFAAFVMCCITAGLATQQFVLFYIPFFTITVFLVLFRPVLVLPLFILTFYIGIPLISRTMFGVFTADITFVLFGAAFFSRLFKSGDLSFQVPPTTMRITYILALLFIVSAFSILFNVQMKEGVNIIVSVWYMVNLLQLIIVFLICSHEEIASTREQCINLVLLLSILEGIIASLQFFQTGYADVNTLRDVKGTFLTHHAMLGNMMVFSLAFCIYRLSITPPSFKRAIYFTGVALSLYVIVISSARSTLVGCVFALIVWLFITFKISWKYITSLIMVGAVVVGLILFTPLYRIIIDTMANSNGTLLDVSSLGRILIWKGALQQFSEAPLINKFFGIGIGNYYTMKYSFQLIEGANITSGAHNNFLHVLIETGIAGLALFMLLFGVILSALKKRASTDRLCLVLFYATLALIFSGLTQETFWFQPAFCRFWLMYMVFLGFCVREKPDQPSAMVPS